MAINVVQIGYGLVTSAKSVSATLNAAVPAGALIGVIFQDNDQYGQGTVQDAAGNTYLGFHADVNGSSANGCVGMLWSQDCLAVNNSTTLTYTVSNSASPPVGLEIIVFY